MKFQMLGLAALLVTGHINAADFDIAILNGRVMDPETSFDAVRNVGISGGKIVTITEDDIAGDETIDAAGHVVAPGFIDMHSHVTNIPFSQKLLLRMGVTSPLDLEVGAWPVENYYTNLKGRSQTNYGATVSLFGIRETLQNPRYKSSTGNISTDILLKDEHAFADMSFQATPTPEQIAEVIRLARLGMDQGALGIAVPVGYAVTGITSEEVLGVQKIIGEYKSATFVHGRFSSQASPTSGVLGFSEFIANTGIYGGGVMFHHLHQQALDLTPMALDMIDDAQAGEMNVVAEIYPYNFGATIVGADYLVPDNYGPNMGRSYPDIIEAATGDALNKERYEALIAADPGTQVIFYGAKNEVMLSALAHPSTVVGSDSMPMTITATGDPAIAWNTPYEAVSGHPRGSGTYPLILSLVRDQDLMPLMTAVSKMSFQVAVFLEKSGVKQMASKGRLQVGADADITIFDPETVQANSTLDAAGLPATGIPFVIVNGTTVVRDSKVLEGVYPGQPIRNPVIN